jgi:hypothetical protein
LQASLQLKHIAAQETLFDAGFTPSAGFEGYTDSVESEFLSRHVLIDGLACVPLRPLDPGKTTDVDNHPSVSFSMCFLSKGTYNLACSVTEQSDPPVSQQRRITVTKAVNVVVQ